MFQTRGVGLETKRILAIHILHPAVVMDKPASFSITRMGKEVFIMKKYFAMFKENTQSLKDVKVLVGVSLFCALNVILNMFSIQLTPMLKISFGSIAVAASCYFYGPYPNMIAAFILDTVNYLLRPVGPYQPWWMINAVVTAFLYALFFYKQEKISVLRCLLARLSVVLIVNLFLNPLWLSMLYGDSFWVLLSARIVKNILMFPIDVAVLYLTMKLCMRLKDQVRI